MTSFNHPNDRLRAAAMSGKPASSPFSQPKKPVGNKPTGEQTKLPNGFTAEESRILHLALELANLRWFDGEEVVMGKRDNFELYFRPGQSANLRWVVMGFPLYDMNQPNAAEVCLHFMAESFDMIHVLDFQYHIGINMESEVLEFLVQLPLNGMTGAQLAELIKVFFDTLSESVLKELNNILKVMEEQR